MNPESDLGQRVHPLRDLITHAGAGDDLVGQRADVAVVVLVGSQDIEKGPQLGQRLSCRIINDPEGLAKLIRVVRIASGHDLHRDDRDVVGHHIVQFTREVVALLLPDRLLMGLDPLELRMDLCGTDDEVFQCQARQGASQDRQEGYPPECHGIAYFCYG